ncbi:conserved hypothetical protein [gamma proteobacterium NOR5-3]|nr:conserved hypothetical protein [gamma proteobacterium NOR5-3]
MPNADTSHSTDNNLKNPESPPITILKKASTRSLEGKATLGYQLGINDTSALYWRLVSNSGGGFFSEEWVALKAIQDALNNWPQDRPITSMALRSLFLGKSANNPSFLMATLVKEGVLERKPGTKRHYQLGDVKEFLTTVEKLKTGHSQPSKPRAKAKAKAGSRMAKAKATPATSK